MYKISVPIILNHPRFERYYKTYIEQCRQADVSRVFLCTTSWTSPESEKQHCIDLLNQYIPIFRAEGFEVGIWINSLGHGSTCGDFINLDTGDGLTRMKSLDGNVNMGAYCPLCENLQALAADWICRLGQTDLDLIMMAKRKDNRISVALWNFGVDVIRDLKVRLGAEGHALTCDWGKASLASEVVTVDSLAAFKCVCFTVEM